MQPGSMTGVRDASVTPRAVTIFARWRVVSATYTRRDLVVPTITKRARGRPGDHTVTRWPI